MNPGSAGHTMSKATTSAGKASPRHTRDNCRFLEIFHEPSFAEKVRKIVVGLRQPRNSGQYKWAQFQMLRLLSPLSAIVVPLFLLLFLAFFSKNYSLLDRNISVTLIEPETAEHLEMPEPIREPEPDQLEPVSVTIPVEVNTLPPPIEHKAVELSPQPLSFDAVALVKSPVVMKGIYGSRTPGARGEALHTYGGSDATEGAVLRALRWLQKFQESDGSWWGRAGGYVGQHDQVPEALTALALLTFLAHGETPGSEEFGETVEKAIRWLLQRQRPDGFYTQTGGSMGYTHPIVTYALCEAYSLTRIPEVRDAAEKALDYLLKGQHVDGGWDYHCQQSQRIDVSICAWCIQALKAARMGGAGSPARIDEAMRNAKKAFTQVLFEAEDGSFKYHNQDSYRGQFKPLTAAALLSLMFIGEAGCVEARRGLAWLDKNATIEWDKPWGDSPIYYWYYTTQVMFHAGGDRWSRWNRQFSRELVENQIVLKGAGINGKDIGYWKAPKEGGYDGFSYVYNTAMCALQLQVYYRYLPTYKTPENVEFLAETERAGEIEVMVEFK
ncbi:MAG: terpene cyclase/mutase family protein [Kiritimatiellae bacterium]|nr:terpene cyclase/mutase family protein [Kiritimatiellia bacterium]